MTLTVDTSKMKDRDVKELSDYLWLQNVSVDKRTNNWKVVIPGNFRPNTVKNIRKEIDRLGGLVGVE